MNALPTERPQVAPAGVRMLLVSRPDEAPAWRRHFETAQSAGAVAALPLAPAPQRIQSLPDGAGLEPCGMPLAPGVAGASVHAAMPAGVAAEAASAPETSRGERPECERSPVRVHVEHPGGEGLRIWLGIDGGVPGVNQHAASMVAELRRALHRMPDRVAAVVCNGATVYAAAAPPGPLRAPGSSPVPLSKDSP